MGHDAKKRGGGGGKAVGTKGMEYRIKPAFLLIYNLF